MSNQKKPENLKVAYLSGPNPENDLRVFCEAGILPENIWAFESGDFGDALYIYSFEMMVIGGKLVGAGEMFTFTVSLAWVSQSVKRGETIVQQKGYNLINP
ncbi:MAG: hypothetical protein J7K84_00230 [Deltaproteobacteria bacterium]|nr:hypothetical protein [Deltaproteobacteria bacterium]